MLNTGIQNQTTKIIKKLSLIVTGVLNLTGLKKKHKLPVINEINALIKNADQLYSLKYNATKQAITISPEITKREIPKNFSISQKLMYFLYSITPVLFTN